MGLVLGLSLLSALGGGAAAWALFDRGRALRRYDNRRNRAAVCLILAMLCAGFTVVAVRLALAIIAF